MQYGLTMGRQDQLHRAVIRSLSQSMSFEDMYLAFALEDMERAPRPEMFNEKGKRIPVSLPTFENGMHHDRFFESNAKENPRNLSFPPRWSCAKTNCNETRSLVTNSCAHISRVRWRADSHFLFWHLRVKMSKH